ncbi:conserved protein, unknown function [Plasmodium gallinaceum]|uniref:Saccharopine dehydrogenase NADP binding domain-containing protein n=1 Tax=Plasmodium gallinaceum TaxID=5849 RepID=A0A1J1GPG6_PLAGA|nr:conserved protein, unknown function [Plasmodium gallinaceum]CRG94391.1 conserved protein, unknown function [Plasmodium gallinaceum]
MNEKKYDILLLGSTGYTGKMVLEYLLKNYETKIINDEIKLLCAVRSIDRLSKVLISIKEKNNVKIEKINKMECDINDYESILNCCKISNVVISTIGPYAMYGYNIVKGCIEGNAHYLDICGEHTFILKIYKEFNKQAKDKKLKIIHSASFISAISDLGNFIIQNEFLNLYKKPCPYIRVRMSTEGSDLTTIGKATIKSSLLFKKNVGNSYNKHYLCDNKYEHDISCEKKCQQNNSFFDYEKEFGYCFDTAYSKVEEAYVLWSNYLLNYKYGKDLVVDYKQYDPHLTTIKYIIKKIFSIISNFFRSFILPDYFINKYVDLIYKPKTSDELKKAYWKCILIGESHDENMNEKIALYLSGKNEDPGYLLTSKIISESAIALLQDNLPDNFGVVSISVGLGKVIVDRLKKASINIHVEK